MKHVEDYAQVFQLHWMRFATELELGSEQQQSIYHRLFSAYTEPQRTYHTIQHIVECLDLLHLIQHELDDAIAVEIAIWFHDVIYQPKSSDNELQSAELMKLICVDILNDAQLQKVYGWIIATQFHQQAEEIDLQYLLDIDLAILGSSKERFAEYEQQIRFEYSWVDSDLYQVKRRAVLQHFAEMQPLYQTDYFQQHLEYKAKLNLSSVLV